MMSKAATLTLGVLESRRGMRQPEHLSEMGRGGRTKLIVDTVRIHLGRRLGKPWTQGPPTSSVDSEAYMCPSRVLM